MRRILGVKARYGAFLLGLSLVAAAPVQAGVIATVSGNVRTAWVSPNSALTANSVFGQGAFGWEIMVPATWTGPNKGWTLRYTGGPYPSPMLTPDVDVYFQRADNTWDFARGVNPGDEACTPSSTPCIPAGTVRALVMVSYFTPHAMNVPFTFQVTSP